VKPASRIPCMRGGTRLKDSNVGEPECGSVIK
jgi:hypothetical protein